MDEKMRFVCENFESLHIVLDTLNFLVMIFA